MPPRPPPGSAPGQNGGCRGAGRGARPQGPAWQGQGKAKPKAKNGPQTLFRYSRGLGSYNNIIYFDGGGAWSTIPFFSIGFSFHQSFESTHVRIEPKGKGGRGRSIELHSMYLYGEIYTVVPVVSARAKAADLPPSGIDLNYRLGHIERGRTIKRSRERDRVSSFTGVVPDSSLDRPFFVAAVTVSLQLVLFMVPPQF